MKTGQDNGKKLIRMINIARRHYGILLETRKMSTSSLFLVEDDSGTLMVEDEGGDLCSFKSVRKVHEVNCHKSKQQLMAAYRNASWMSYSGSKGVWK